MMAAATSTAAMAAAAPARPLRPSRPLLLMVASIGMLAKPANALVFGASRSALCGVQLSATRVSSSESGRAAVEADALCRVSQRDAENLAGEPTCSPKHGRDHSTTRLPPVPVRLCQSCLSMKVSGNVELEFAFDEDEEDDEMEEHGSTVDNIDEIHNMTVAQIKEELVKFGLKGRGRKADMVSQLQNAVMRKKSGIDMHDTEVNEDPQPKWYMVQTANGFERAVETYIKLTVDVQRLGDQITDTFLPIMEGATSVRESSVMPSYIFVKMKMNKQLYELVSNMQYVVNFVGADRGGRTRSGQMQGTRGFVLPLPVTDDKIAHVRSLTKQQVADAIEEMASQFAVGDTVEVTKGPFKGMRGAVSDATGEDITVLLAVMGIETPVPLHASQCAKAEEAAEA